jgi:hypothetical protein
MYNMIIESVRKTQARHVGPYEWGRPLTGVDHQVPAYFANFIAMHEDP